MEILDIHKLYEVDFNLYNIYAMNQKWENEKVISITDRRNTALFYVKDCSVEYTFEDGQNLLVPKGNIVLLPQGCTYKVKFTLGSKQFADAQLVEFEMKDDQNRRITAAKQVEVIANDDNPLLQDLFCEAVNVFNRPVFSYTVCKAAVYSLIAEISKQHKQRNMFATNLITIQPALAYLEKNIYLGNDVKQLAELCNLSEVSFRKKFKEYSGTTPLEFIIESKIQKAKKLLRSDLYTVREVAEILGYEDPSYFTKVFKKHTGMLPRDYMKRSLLY